ncbi:MAG: response regulator [Candidatus Omnitrophica bacterium]|nr:response regulator [Candidatus Omnitrophota bacterium]
MSGTILKKILIVDDAPQNRELLKEVLVEDKQSYQIKEAEDGVTALRMIDEELPDIILLDIQMPGIDGYEVCRRLKADEKYKEIPIIFITAFTAAPDKIKAYELGAADYITKPINISEVRSKVSLCLKAK